MVSSVLVIVIVIIIIVVVPQNSSASTELVDRICKKTSDYTWCVKCLYSDRRTPEADQVTLAYIAVDLAYNYAAATRDLISSDLKLQGCAGDYANAVSKMQMASNDVNSETFSELESLSAKAYDSADHCQKAFPSYLALIKRNNDFKALCQILAAVGKLFTGSIGF